MATQSEATATPTAKKLTLAGLATAALSPIVLPFTEWAQNNPMLAIPLVVVWEGLLLAVYFWLDVWAEVRPMLVNRAADALKFRIDGLISRHRKRYLEDVVFQHRNFDVKGLINQGPFALELEQVFVDLSVAPIAPHDASADMIRKLPAKLREGRHQVWDFLEQGAAKLIILGAPGSGKTTLLKHLSLTLAHGRSPRANLKASRNLPILLFLRDHVSAIVDNPNVPLSELVATAQKKRQKEIPAAWFESQLRGERCLVLLDGLDEVADPEARSKVAKWAESQMSIHAGNRFVMTSRPHGYRDNPIEGVNVLDVRPFDAVQVGDFVNRWYVANEVKAQQRDDPGVRQDARTGAGDLLNRLHGTPALSDLAVNPLLLTMIATVHRYRSSLPGRRVELYAEICEVSLGKRQQSKGLVLDLTPAQKQRVLEPLAWAMMVAKKREIPTDDACAAIKDTLRRVDRRIDPKSFLKSVEEDSSLLLEKEAGGVYAFAHLTFQEYLAACHAQQDQERIDLLSQNVGDGWWAECLRLFAATGDATPILTACLDRRPLDPEALALALQCLEEAETKAPQVEKELQRIVEAGLNDPDPTKRKPIAGALLKLRLARLRRLDERRYIDPELISHAEYQLFLDEMAAKGEDRCPIHWTTKRFLEGEGRSPVVGLSYADAWAFCNWLTQWQGGQSRFRLPIAEERDAEGVADGSAEVSAWALTGGRESGPMRWPMQFQERLKETAIHWDDLYFFPRFDLDVDLDRARDLARSLAREPALGPARAPLRDLAYVLDPGLNLDTAVDHARALAQRLNRNLNQNLDRARALPLAHALPITPDLDRDLALDRDRSYCC